MSQSSAADLKSGLGFFFFTRREEEGGDFFLVDLFRFKWISLLQRFNTFKHLIKPKVSQGFKKKKKSKSLKVIQTQENIVEHRL